MSTLHAPILRRTFSARLRWGCGLLVFAAGCYAIFGWLLGGSFHDEAGNQLLFYAGFHEGHISVLSFVLGGLATGALALLLLDPFIWRLNLRPWVLDMTLTLLASLIGLALLLGWAMACLVVFLGAFVNPLQEIIAADGQRVLIERSGYDGSLLSVWVPYSRFMFVQDPQNEDFGFDAVRPEDCTLNAAAQPWVLSCAGTDLFLDEARSATLQ